MNWSNKQRTGHSIRFDDLSINCIRAHVNVGVQSAYDFIPDQNGAHHFDWNRIDNPTCNTITFGQ